MSMLFCCSTCFFYLHYSFSSAAFRCSAVKQKQRHPSPVSRHGCTQHVRRGGSLDLASALQAECVNFQLRRNRLTGCCWRWSCEDDSSVCDTVNDIVMVTHILTESMNPLKNPVSQMPQPLPPRNIGNQIGGIRPAASKTSRFGHVHLN